MWINGLEWLKTGEKWKMRIPLLCNFGAVVLKFYSGRCRFTKICYNEDEEENQTGMDLAFGRTPQKEVV